MRISTTHGVSGSFQTLNGSAGGGVVNHSPKSGSLKLLHADVLSFIRIDCASSEEVTLIHKSTILESCAFMGELLSFTIFLSADHAP